MNWTNLRIIIVLSIIGFLVVGSLGSGLAEEFDEEEVKKQAQEVVKILNDNKMEELLERSTEEVEKALTEDKEAMEGLSAFLSEGGELENFEDVKVKGEKDKRSKEEFAAAILEVKHEHKIITYTITYNKEMKIAGILYK